MAPEKTEGPNQVLTFAGIELDCLNLEARLPIEKVDKTLKAIRNLLPRKKKSSTERAPIACRSLKFRLFGHNPWQSFYPATDKPHHWCTTCTPQYPSNQRN